MITPLTVRKRSAFILSVWLLVLPACAVISPPPLPPQPAVKESPPTQSHPEISYWWYARVKIAWPEEQPIAWYVDVLLAHQLFKPVLVEYSDQIELWRFHRRAARDKAGHRFSFIFYAPESTARAILDTLSENPLIPQLISAKVVDKVILDEANKSPSSAIEATSDKNWSQAMQRAWPYFAMGVSQVWLGLIDQHVASVAHNRDNLPETTNVDALLSFYRQIDEKLVATWETEGGHAFLHHLNALFGYGDVAIYERRMTRF